MLAAAIAAYFWLMTSFVKTPSSFPITVTSTHTMLDQVLGGRVVSTGSSPEINQIGEALIEQARLNAWAALFAAAAAALQAADFLWGLLHTAPGV